MKRAWYSIGLAVLVGAACFGTVAQAVDLRRGVPEDAWLVVQNKYNPERDFQRQYYADVWKAVRETQLLERVVKIITSRMEAGQVEQAKGVIDELHQAVKPIDLPALAKSPEAIYAQIMQTSPLPTAQHLLLIRATADTAAATAQGIKNLFDLAEQHSGGALSVVESQVGEATVWTLELPPSSPFQPGVAHVGEIVALSTSRELLTKSLQMIDAGTGPSKFDDPRLVAALQQLPEPEDGLVFYDGLAQLAALRGLGSVLTNLRGNDAQVERAARLLDKLWDDLAIIDFAVKVEYTEGNLNRTASYGKMAPGSGQATLGKMLFSGQPFGQWSAWVPAGALSYALGTGINLHPLYERIMAVLEQDVPEAAPALARFAEIQEQLDLYLDRDLLQSFSGEHVSVLLPAAASGRPDSVIALRCQNPDRIKELIHRGLEALQQLKPFRDQQVNLVASQELPGFEDLTAVALTALGVRPVLGFQNGWMYVGSNASAVKKVLETQAGRGQTIEGTEAFTRLKLDISGSVNSIRYAHTAENIRRTAKTLNQLGFTAQMYLAMLAGNAKPEDLKSIQDALALLPDVAKIVEKFDFLEARASVTQPGKEPGSFVGRSVTVVRPAAE